MTARYTRMNQLADELGITADALARHLVEDQGVPDLNGWQDDWTLHPREVEQARAYFTQED